MPKRKEQTEIPNNGHWLYPIDIDISQWFGFVYRIVEKDTTKHYIGKKQFHSYSKKRIKGRVNRKTITSESNWKLYTGSSTQLNENIALKGKDNYSFIIETLHETRGSLFYAEVERQITENVLRETLEDGTRKYYNGHIAGVKFIPPAITNEEAYADIRNYVINEEYGIIFQDNAGENNGRWGSTDVKAGLTYEDYYGEEKSQAIKQKLHEANIGKVQTLQIGIPKHSEAQKLAWKADERRKHRGSSNGMFGIPCTHRMSEEEIQAWKDNISKATKGKPKKLVTCPHCGKEGGNGVMQRHHFNNCKNR